MTDTPKTLAPCPFCGDPMEWWGEDMIRHREAGKCPIGMMGFTTQHIAAWNRRALPSDDEMVERVARAICCADAAMCRAETCAAEHPVILDMARAAIAAMRGE